MNSLKINYCQITTLFWSVLLAKYGKQDEDPNHLSASCVVES